jgi:hypothetical protein
VLHGRRTAANLPRNYINGIGYQEFAYLIDLFFSPGTPQRLLLYASVDEDHAVSPRAAGNLLYWAHNSHTGRGEDQVYRSLSEIVLTGMSVPPTSAD